MLERVTPEKQMPAAPRDPMLQIHHTHACDPKSILGAANINTSFSIDISIFRIFFSRSVVQEMDAINAKISKLYRADTRAAVSADIKSGSGFSLPSEAGGRSTRTRLPPGHNS